MPIPNSTEIISRATTNFNNIKDSLEYCGLDLTGLTSDDYADLIESLRNNIQASKTVSPTTSQQEVTADAGYDSLTKVIVNAVTADIDNNIVPEKIKKDVSILGVTGTYEGSGSEPSLQVKTATPSTSGQYIQPDIGYDGLEYVFVEAVDSDIDVNIQASNIKKDVTILGITGTYEGGSGGTLITNIRHLFYYRKYSDLADKVDWNNLTIATQAFEEATLDAQNIHMDLHNLSSDAAVTDCFYNSKPTSQGALVVIKLGTSSSSRTLYQMFRYAGYYSGGTYYKVNVQFDDNTPSSNNGITMYKAFSNSKLGTVDFTNLNGAKVRDITEIFRGATVIDALNINDIDTSAITNFKYAFEGFYMRTANKKLDISDWSFAACTNLTEMFERTSEYDKSLYEIDIDTSTVNSQQSFYRMFFGQSYLTKIGGNLDLSKCNNTAAIFDYCSRLVTIETTGSLGGDVASAQTFDLSDSNVFDIASFINSLATNNSGYTKTIKLHLTVYSGLSQDTINAATAKNYTLA